MRLVLLAVALLTAPALAADNTTCDYPVRAGSASGTSVIGFSPQSDGRFAKVVLRHSSGSAELDRAAVACVSGWHYDPTASADQHWIAGGLTTITWTIDPEQGPAGLRSGVPHYCDVMPTLGPKGDTTLRFTISASGHVRDVEVANSSGTASADQSAVACAAYWRYKPAIKDDVPVAVPWTAKVLWSEAVADAPVVVIEPFSLPNPQTP